MGAREPVTYVLRWPFSALSFGFYPLFAAAFATVVLWFVHRALGVLAAAVLAMLVWWLLRMKIAISDDSVLVLNAFRRWSFRTQEVRHLGFGRVWVPHPGSILNPVPTLTLFDGREIKVACAFGYTHGHRLSDTTRSRWEQLRIAAKAAGVDVTPFRIRLDEDSPFER